MERFGRMNGLRRWVWSFAVLAAGCGGPTDSVESGGPTTEPGKDPSEVVERRPVPGNFPYLARDGSGITCGRHELLAADGTVLGRETEWYPLERMNRHLRNAGTAEGLAHIDAAFRDALSAKGIRSIETCEDGREYARLVHERLSLQKDVPLSAQRLPPPSDAPPELDLAGEDEELVNKVINGSPFDHPSTVGIETFHPFISEKCSGLLIGPFAMLTAAHCFQIPGLASQPITAWFQAANGARTCITHAGANCPDVTGAAQNAFIVIHPSWDGSSSAFDLALVLSTPWLAPANTASRWSRFAANWGLPLWMGIKQNVVKIAGYGYGNAAGTQALGVGRRGGSQTITWIDDTQTVIGVPRVAAGSSGACRGDSGSGVYSTDTIGENLIFGVASKVTAEAGNGGCLAVGQLGKYTIPDGGWIVNNVTFFGGTCSTFMHTASSMTYARCW